MPDPIQSNQSILSYYRDFEPNQCMMTPAPAKTAAATASAPAAAPAGELGPGAATLVEAQRNSCKEQYLQAIQTCELAVRNALNAARTHWAAGIVAGVVGGMQCGAAVRNAYDCHAESL